MKKVVLLFTLMLNIIVLGQNKVCVYYQLESKTNLNPDTPPDVDIYILEIDTQHNTSKFYNAIYKSLDSLNSKLAKLSKVVGAVEYNTKEMRYPKFNIGVIDLGDKYDVYRIFDGDIYRYSETKNTTWDIHEDVEKIGNYNARKATAKVNGRDWEVFYTDEIPLSFGPYVLGQLPGLILSAKDSTNSYVFKLIGLEQNQLNDDDYLPAAFKRAVSVSKKKYRKAYETYKKDPAKKLKQNIITQPDGGYMILANPLPKEYIKRKEAEWIKYYKENDNDIDKS